MWPKLRFSVSIDAKGRLRGCGITASDPCAQRKLKAQTNSNFGGWWWHHGICKTIRGRGEQRLPRTSRTQTKWSLEHVQVDRGSEISPTTNEETRPIQELVGEKLEEHS